MRAKFIYEKFTDVSDPIHDMGIGDPLHIAGSKLERYANEHGYHFEMKKISGVESPIIIVDLPKPYFIFWDGYMKPGACYIHKLKYTITYMPHQKPNVYSLRKVWMGYTSGKKDRSLKILKQEMKSGKAKEKNLNQQLMGRFPKDGIPTMIKRIEYSIKNESKKK